MFEGLRQAGFDDLTQTETTLAKSERVVFGMIDEIIYGFQQLWATFAPEVSLFKVLYRIDESLSIFEYLIRTGARRE